MVGSAAFVFAYASLLADAVGAGSAASARHPDPAVPVARADRPLVALRDHARDWSVAMDNRETLPGYKYYTLAGRRPACHVAFLTVVPEPGSAVQGIAVPVTPAALDALDERERNYHRVEVTAQVTPAPPGRTFTYVASAAGRARFDHACATGSGVVQQAYLDAVEAGYRGRGSEAVAHFRASTRPAPFPVLPLERHDVPPGAAGSA